MHKVVLLIVFFCGHVLYADIDFDALEKKKVKHKSLSVNFSDATKAGDRQWQKQQEENREREARLARQRANSSSRYGLSQNQCYRTSGNYALYKYCTTGDCNGFVSNYALHQLCSNDSARGFYGSDRMVNIRLYLENGGYLSYDYFSDKAAYQSGKHNRSFRERKNYILYLLSGMVLVRY